MWVCGAAADSKKIMQLAKERGIKIQASPHKVEVSRNGYRFLGSDTGLFDMFDGTH